MSPQKPLKLLYADMLGCKGLNLLNDDGEAGKVILPDFREVGTGSMIANAAAQRCNDSRRKMTQVVDLLKPVASWSLEPMLVPSNTWPWVKSIELLPTSKIVLKIGCVIADQISTSGTDEVVSDVLRV